MEVVEALRRALQAVEEAEIPTDLRTVAFKKAIEVMLNPSVTGQSGKSHHEPHLDPPPADDTDAFGKIAKGLSVNRRTVEDFFVIEDGELSLTVPTGKIDRSTKTGARQVCVLVASARQKSGLDDGWTERSHLVDACTHYDKYDRTNFSRHLKAMDDVFQIKGSGAKVTVKVKQGGFEEATQLIRDIANSDS